jgi:hypothetical protein
MSQFDDERFFDFGSSLAINHDAKPLPDDYIADDPDYVLLKNGNHYRVAIKNPQSTTVGISLGNSEDDDIPALINSFDCNDESKAKLLSQFEALKGKHTNMASFATVDRPKGDRKPPKEDYREWHSPPTFCKYTR